MRLLLPGLTFRDESGALDISDCERYARRADRTWVAGFIVCGSNGQGSCMTQDERITLLDLWLQNTSAERVVMCCWSATDHEVALARGVTPLLTSSLFKSVGTAYSHCLIYSHPNDSPVDLCSLRELVNGAKVSKVDLRTLSHFRSWFGRDFELLHGSSRSCAASLAAGASGIVSSALSVVPSPFPRSDVHSTQLAADRIQSVLDSVGSKTLRTRALTTMARAQWN